MKKCLALSLSDAVFIMLLNVKMPTIFNQYLSNVKSPFGDNWRAELTTSFMEKISFKTLRSLDKALINEFIWWGQ